MIDFIPLQNYFDIFLNVVFFSVAFEGTDSGDYYVSGKGFLTGLTPTASIDQAVWISPMEIVVNGELTKTTIS